MKKVSQFKLSLLIMALLLLLSAFSFMAYTRAAAYCSEVKEQCKIDNGGGEMLWDVFSRHFVSASRSQ